MGIDQHFEASELTMSWQRYRGINGIDVCLFSYHLLSVLLSSLSILSLISMLFFLTIHLLSLISSLFSLLSYFSLLSSLFSSLLFYSMLSYLVLAYPTLPIYLSSLSFCLFVRPSIHPSFYVCIYIYIDR